VEAVITPDITCAAPKLTVERWLYRDDVFWPADAWAGFTRYLPRTKPTITNVFEADEM